MTPMKKHEAVELKIKKKYLIELLKKAERTKPVTCIHIYADYDDDDLLTIVVNDHTSEF